MIYNLIIKRWKTQRNQKERQKQMITKNEKMDLMSKAYYLTQYASYQTDEDFLTAFVESIESKEIDKNLLTELLELMEDSTDELNKKVFDNLLFHLNDEIIERLITLYNAFDNEDIPELEKLFKIDFYQLYDGYVGDYHFFEEMADFDFRSNGINARAIEWAHKIPTNEDVMYELDIYDDFSEVTSYHIIEKMIDHGYLDNFLKEIKED